MNRKNKNNSHIKIIYIFYLLLCLTKKLIFTTGESDDNKKNSILISLLDNQITIAQDTKDKINSYLHLDLNTTKNNPLNKLSKMISIDFMNINQSTIDISFLEEIIENYYYLNHCLTDFNYAVIEKNIKKLTTRRFLDLFLLKNSYSGKVIYPRNQHPNFREAVLIEDTENGTVKIAKIIPTANLKKEENQNFLYLLSEEEQKITTNVKISDLYNFIKKFIEIYKKNPQFLILCLSNQEIIKSIIEKKEAEIAKIKQPSLYQKIKNRLTTFFSFLKKKDNLKKTEEIVKKYSGELQ